MRRWLTAVLAALAVAGLLAAAAEQRRSAAMLAAAPMGVSTGCTQASNYIARLTAGENTAALTTLMCNLVVDQLITGDLTTAGTTKCGALFDRFYIFAVANNSNAVKDVCGNTDATLSGAAFTANQGYIGTDASSTFIDTGFNPVTAGGHFAANNAHGMAWSLTATQATAPGGTIIGQSDGAGSFFQIAPYWSDGGAHCFMNQNAAVHVAGIGTAAGAWVCDRDAPNSSNFYQNGAFIGGNNSTATTALINDNIYILARNKVGTGAESGAANRIAAVTFGGHLTAAQISSSGGTTGNGLVPRLCAYLTTVRGSC